MSDVNDEGRMDVELALRCMGAEATAIGHAPTVINVLGDEVLRLRAALDSAPEASDKDAQEFIHQQVIEALLLVVSAQETTNGDDRKRRLIQTIDHLRRALGLDARYAVSARN
jgi:hypothetical protein